MKLSIEDANGSDFYKAALTKRAVILLDGKRVERCTEANEEEGYVIVLIAQEDPRFKTEMIKQGRDCWPVETLRGKVQIIDPDKQP